MIEPVIPISGIELLRREKLDACTHCGLCLPTCPTYSELGLETDSPRGRIYLTNGIIEEENPVPIGKEFAKYIYRCLDCRACETACPSGVHFGEIIEAARAIYEMNTDRPWYQKILRDLVFRKLLPNKENLSLLFTLIWLYQKTGIRTIVQKTGILKLMGRLGEMESMLPSLPNPLMKSEIREFLPAKGETKHRVGFIPGCVMNQIFVDTNLATVRVLNENGCDVVIPSQQTCCGALHVHNSDYETAVKLAMQNIQAFDLDDLDAIVINSAGCGATLKEYDVLMHHQSSDYLKKAALFCAKMVDISEFLGSIDFVPPQGNINRRVTYDEPCHLVHGQQVRNEPRFLLRSIPGLELVELQESEWCCGSAGIYNITQPEMSKQILERKMEHITNTGAEIVATGNPGCIMQIQVGIRRHKLPMFVMHPIDLLDCSYRNIDPLVN